MCTDEDSHELSVHITVNHPKSQPPSIFCHVTVPHYHAPPPPSSKRWLLLLVLLLAPFVGAFSPAGILETRWFGRAANRRPDVALDVSYVGEEFSEDFAYDFPPEDFDLELASDFFADFMEGSGLASDLRVRRTASPYPSYRGMKVEALKKRRATERTITRHLRLWHRFGAIKGIKHTAELRASRDAALLGTADTTTLDSVGLLSELARGTLGVEEAQFTVAGAVATGIIQNATSAVLTGHEFNVSQLCEPISVARWIIRYSLVPTAAHTAMHKLTHTLVQACPWATSIVQHATTHSTFIN